MKLSLQLKLGQQLTMTPQLQQAIRLLQLSTLDLQQEIQEALESNPMLEIEEDFDGDAPAPGEKGDKLDTAPVDLDGEVRDGEAPSSDDDFQEATDFNAEDNWNDSDIPEEMSVDSSWDDVYTNTQTSSSSNNDHDDYDGDFESRNSAGTTLQDHLMWQLNLTPMSDGDRLIAAFKIETGSDTKKWFAFDYRVLPSGELVRVA